MALKRKTEVVVPVEESDQLIIRPLGAGQEVGRSCIMLEFKGKKIMLDCGIHPGMTGLDALPYTDMVDPAEIDLLLVSHFHLDHCGALPWFLEKTTFRGRCFMTHATKAIYRWLLSDYVKVSNISTESMLYADSDIENSMEKIETVNFHQETEVNGIKFWCYTAGHVLGAAMFMIEIAGVKILYTGDFSRQEDRHLSAAEIPNIRPDILITESTYGTHVHEDRGAREDRFTSLVHDIVNRGGRCLIPVFALGRAQELLLILDEYWANHPELHDIPIYYASSLARKCMSVFQTYVSAMNEKIREQISISNPFVFKHISNLKSMEHFEDIGPSVVLASPGMMQSGLSRELFETWCMDKRNGTIIAGYCVEGTLAKHILSEPEEIVTMMGAKLPLRCSVDYISFSAHTDYKQTSEFIRILKPVHIVLVHGEANEMARLKSALQREYEDDPDYNIEVYNPANTEPVTLTFRGEKMAKVVGKLAAKRPSEDALVSGVLVKRNFNYHVMDPSDIPNYTQLVLSTVTQRQSVSYTGTLQQLQFFLAQLSGDIERIGAKEKPQLCIFKSIVLTVDKKMVTLEWNANPVSDMYADAVLTVVLKAESETNPSKAYPPPVDVDSAHFRECLLETLTEMFGQDAVPKLLKDDVMDVTVNDNTAQINLNSLDVSCEDDDLQQMVHTVVNKLYHSITPVKLPAITQS